MKQVVIQGRHISMAYNLDDAIDVIEQWCDEHNGVHEDPYEQDDVICVDISCFYTDPETNETKSKDLVAKVFEYPSRSGFFASQKLMPLKPVDYNEQCDAWRVLTDDGQRTVVKDGFNTREEASKWAREHTTLPSWLIEGYRYNCVINFKERDFNSSDNL